MAFKTYYKALGRFLLSSHRLQIEPDRQHKPQQVQFNDWKCTLCMVQFSLYNVHNGDLNNIISFGICIFCYQSEDEFNLVCECPKYEPIRMYVPNHIASRRSTHTCIGFVCKYDPTTLKNIALFIIKAIFL